MSPPDEIATDIGFGIERHRQIYNSGDHHHRGAQTVGDQRNTERRRPVADLRCEDAVCMNMINKQAAGDRVQTGIGESQPE